MQESLFFLTLRVFALCMYVGVIIIQSTVLRDEICSFAYRRTIKTNKICSSSIRNKKLIEGVETIASSSSHDEADAEDSPTKFRKRRKMLRKRSKHKVKCSKHSKGVVSLAEVHTFSEGEGDSDLEIKRQTSKDSSGQILPRVNSLVERIKLGIPAVYLEESSSCSELGKDASVLEVHEAPCATSFLAALNPRATE